MAIPLEWLGSEYRSGEEETEEKTDENESGVGVESDITPSNRCLIRTRDNLYAKFCDDFNADVRAHHERFSLVLLQEKKWETNWESMASRLEAKIV